MGTEPGDRGTRPTRGACQGFARFKVREGLKERNQAKRTQVCPEIDVKRLFLWLQSAQTAKGASGREAILKEKKEFTIISWTLVYNLFCH